MEPDAPLVFTLFQLSLCRSWKGLACTRLRGFCKSMARKMLKDGEVAIIGGGGDESYEYDLFVTGAGSGGVCGSCTSAAFGAKVAICELNPISPH